MTERSARLFAQITCVLAMASILAAAVVGVRWRHERDTFVRRLAGACEREP
ncbi:MULTISPECIES: hypothetical protein [unclassified Nannocystis]|uniref:hypothetical protein n=1 Tax=Nannocystis TaxID=53 RepID=UPI002271402E|nr:MULTISPECIES: hypothetical protein [unclassified Nannocystis]MCY0991081.1 hypothetical protein [Nannocystis sp. ILAH1]MCY1064594.1 hypothetical protein [Nannocystis sp. RBIL2]